MFLRNGSTLLEERGGNGQDSASKLKSRQRVNAGNRVALCRSDGGDETGRQQV